eukprot:8743461-Pyramimonas_sp.AAC.1
MVPRTAWERHRNKDGTVRTLPLKLSVEPPSYGATIRVGGAPMKVELHANPVTGAFGGAPK